MLSEVFHKDQKGLLQLWTEIAGETEKRGNGKVLE